MTTFGPLGRPIGSIDAEPRGSTPQRRSRRTRAFARTRGRPRSQVGLLHVGGVALALALVSVAVIVSVPVPFVDSYLTGKVTERIAARVVCPGSTAPPPEITLKGGRIMSQLVHRRLSEIHVSVPDTAVAGVQHAALAATLRGASQSTPSTAKADSVDASITVSFADLPAPPEGPRPSFARAQDGALMVNVAASADQTENVRATLFLKLELQAGSMRAIPQRLRVFGHTLPAAKVTELTGGVRSQKLPPLPEGLRYRSITPEKDGLHVALDGVVTTPLADLPTAVGGRTVSYTVENGLLGISSSAFRVPPVVDAPLTIFTEPRLDGGILTLVPRSVRVLGADRRPDDLIARLVLSRVNKEDLARRLPTLPAGVEYKSVSVDGAGVAVAVGGVTIRPFSGLPRPAGQKTTFGAQDGLLTATVVGGPSSGSPTSIVLFAHPKIVGNTLDLAPETIQVFGVRFPAADVLSEVKAQDTTFPLQVLPAGLTYTGVDVLPDGLRLRVSGRNVALSKGSPGGAGCAAPDSGETLSP